MDQCGAGSASQVPRTLRARHGAAPCRSVTRKVTHLAAWQAASIRPCVAGNCYFNARQLTEALEWFQGLTERIIVNELIAKLEAVISARIQDRERAGWSRNIGAGFVDEDIESVFPLGVERFRLTYSGHVQDFNVKDLNLRELDAVRGWLFKRIAQ